jgi:hypothetical protein
VRRFAPALVALALIAAPTAGAAKPEPRLVVTNGSAHVVGGKLKGWFVVANRGNVPSRPAVAKVKVDVGKPPSRVLIRWTVDRASVPSLAPSRSRRFAFSVGIPTEFGTHRSPITACAATACLRIGRLTLASAWERRHLAGVTAKPSGGSTTSPGGAPVTSPSTTPTSTVPTAPIHYLAGEPFEVSDGAAEYWAYVPTSYDPSNQTPAKLVIWLTAASAKAPATSGSSTLKPPAKGVRTGCRSCSAAANRPGTNAGCRASTKRV